MFVKQRMAGAIFSGLCLLIITALVGCASVGSDSYVKVRPKTEVTRTTTSFSGALRCMDNLYLTHGVHGVPITTIGIPDATGQVRSGIRDMLITAMAQMSHRSGAFRYVDWEYESKELQVLFQQVRDADRTAYEAEYENPRYYIRGAVTQFDQNVVDKRFGGGIAGQYEDYNGDLAADYNASASVVALDLNVGDIRARTIVPGLSSKNSLAIDQRGAAFGGALSNANLGVTFDFQANQAEGIHVAIRTLVELGAIETMGKLTRVPYWQCLQIESSAPGVIQELDDWWRDMSQQEQLLFVQRSLISRGFLSGPASGKRDSETRDAIARYQAEEDLMVSGRPNLELYTSLLGDDRPLELGPPETFVKEDETPDAKADALPLAEPVQIELFTDRGLAPVYEEMESLRAQIQVSGNAFVHCYYQEASGSVMRVFPNRFQPEAQVAAGEIVTVPGRAAGFQIVPTLGGVEEQLMCAASPRDITRYLPKEIQKQDLVPLPVESLDTLAEMLRAIDRTSVSEARLRIAVAANP